jgi:hypothetical protein
MSAGLIIVIVVVVVLVAAALVVLPGQLRTRRLRGRFGPEYERVVDESVDRRTAERDLTEREHRHSTYELRSLSASAREEYLGRWAAIQERFVDEPRAAVGDADQLVTDVLADLGYPTSGFQQQADDLSVRHATQVGRYRAAHALVGADDSTDTDDLRKALLDYREIVRSLLGGSPADQDEDRLQRAERS